MRGRVAAALMVTALVGWILPAGASPLSYEWSRTIGTSLADVATDGTGFTVVTGELQVDEYGGFLVAAYSRYGTELWQDSWKPIRNEPAGTTGKAVTIGPTATSTPSASAGTAGSGVNRVDGSSGRTRVTAHCVGPAKPPAGSRGPVSRRQPASTRGQGASSSRDTSTTTTSARRSRGSGHTDSTARSTGRPGFVSRPPPRSAWLRRTSPSARRGRSSWLGTSWSARSR